MPTSRTRRTRRTSDRPAKATAPPKNAVRRKKQASVRKKRQQSQPHATARKRSSGNALLSWNDLATGNEREAHRPTGSTYIEKVSTVRFGLFLLAVAIVFTLYIGHVQATQEVLAQVQQARRENLNLHLKLNRLKGDFDGATSPAVVYQRARAMGMEEGIAYGPTIEIKGD